MAHGKISLASASGSNYQLEFIVYEVIVYAVGSFLKDALS